MWDQSEKNIPRYDPDPTKRVQNIHQWLSAFNIFVSVYTERFNPTIDEILQSCAGLGAQSQ